MLDSSLQQSRYKPNCMAAELHCKGGECERRNAGRGGKLVWIPECKLALASKQDFGVFQVILSTPLNSFSSLFFSFSFLAEMASSPVGRVSQLEISPPCCKTSSDQKLGLIWDFQLDQLAGMVESLSRAPLSWKEQGSLSPCSLAAVRTPPQHAGL